MKLEMRMLRKRLRIAQMFFVTAPTSYFNRLTNQEAFADGLTVGAGGLTLGDGTQLGGTGANGTVITVPPASTTLTLTAALHANRRLLIASTGGLAITPPAATGTGNVYTFIIKATIAGGNFTIDAKAGNASDIFAGIAWQNKTGTGITTTPTASNTNLITLSGSTTGGIIGDLITMVDAGTNVWNLEIVGQYTGTFATPFSNH